MKLNTLPINFKLNLLVLISILSITDSFGQAPDIGSDSSFVLFTAGGAITNTGNTTIWGDIGTNAGAFTGTPTVYGNTHIVDASSSQAAIDANSAYTFLSTLSCDSTIVSPFGSNLVLTSGKIYCITTAATLTGDLILDANGNSNGIFIIKIDGAFSSSTNSQVLLQNGASFCNVYWQINGSVTLASNTLFNGSIFNNGAINLQSGAAIEGRAISMAGAINLDENTAIGCDAIGNPLAIELIDFSASIRNLQTTLTWSTASEHNNDYFTLERSTDGISFETLGKIKGAGNSNTTTHYKTIDVTPINNIVYFRLSQTDFDGTSIILKTIVVSEKETPNVSIGPNPFNRYLQINIASILELQDKHFKFTLYNSNGKNIFNLNLNELTTILQTEDLIPGIYFYSIYSQKEPLQFGKILLQ